MVNPPICSYLLNKGKGRRKGKEAEMTMTAEISGYVLVRHPCGHDGRYNLTGTHSASARRWILERLARCPCSECFHAVWISAMCTGEGEGKEEEREQAGWARRVRSGMGSKASRRGTGGAERNRTGRMDNEDA